MDHRTSTGTRLSVIPVFIALLMNVVIGPLAPAVNLALPGSSTTAHAADIEVIQDSDTNGCEGVVTTPGSENTQKRLIDGSLEPGGTATFEISYPVDPEDVSGRTEFEITDCVFIDTNPADNKAGTAVAKYFIHFVPNTENFLLTFTLSVPADAPIGSEYCNYAKTTAAPSDSQASNRKAGPACFVVGGALRVLKVDEAGAPLAGATFGIACTWPVSSATLANTILNVPDDGTVTDGNDAGSEDNATESYTSVSGGTLSATAVTGSDGLIAVQAPVGTSCTFTETAAPNGFLPPSAPGNATTLIVPAGGISATHTFTNVRVVRDADPALKILKAADVDSVDAGQEASFTIALWNEGPGTALDVEFEDDLPDGLDWEFEMLSDHDANSCASSADESGTLSISCSFGDLAPSSPADGVRIRVFADTDVTDCGVLDNLAWAEAGNHDRVDATANVTVTCPASRPTLVIDKAADVDEIVISGAAGALDAEPAIVTWTLTYTLTNGPVTNAVISDEIPDGLLYVDGSASDGGVYDPATGAVAWTFATLSESGSVTFETEVDPETISRVAPTVNVAVISSDQTPDDEGQDQVTVTVEEELGGNPTPTPTPRLTLPDTAMGIGTGGEPVTVPIELLAAAFITSLGGLALVNVRARSRRR